MAASGQALELRFVDEINNAGVLSSPFQEPSSKYLTELCEAIADCATKAPVPEVELLSLWSVIHTSVSDVISEAGAVAAQVSTNASEALASDGANAQAIGKMLTGALASSSVLASSVSEELHEALQHLSETGTPIAEHLVGTLRQHMVDFRAVLSEQDWVELQSRSSQSISSEWKAIRDGVDSLVDQAKEATDFVKLTADICIAEQMKCVKATKL
ncbi:hypothetical protein PInf_010205 [Phytophthora infestans]|nr:hypothetical protein PInf_010205 [Phytophthora infestans]